ncbi:MAG TPA: methionyl-tRNA formyltransferase [Chthoniobacteraceae bacterium]|nr:methionyl-tRNA formyltransferase [Chthoniobacteraceae bacterium]
MRILYIGTGDIGAPSLTWLAASGHEIAAVFTQPDKPAGRKMELQPPPIKLLAQKLGIPVFQPVKLRAPDAVEQVRSFGADLIVVMAYGQILPKGVIEAARIACLNLHASILPRHRGAAPIQAAILDGDTETGVTVMYMDPGLDTGDILLIRRTPIRDDDTGGALHDRLAEIAPGALAEAISLLAAGNAPRIPQDNSKATYAGKLGRENGEIRWDLPAEEIARQVRAMNPWPCAFTYLPDRGGIPRKLKVFGADAVSSRSGVPGVVLDSGPDGILAGCASGALLLRDVQWEGKRRMAARDFLLGQPAPPGIILAAAHGNRP